MLSTVFVLPESNKFEAMDSVTNIERTVILTLKAEARGGRIAAGGIYQMEATAAAILVQAMLQSCPPLQGSLREDLQKGGPQAGAEFLKPYFIAVARMLTKAEEKG